MDVTCAKLLELLSTFQEINLCRKYEFIPVPALIDCRLIELVLNLENQALAAIRRILI